MTMNQIEAIEHLDFEPDLPCESVWSNGEEAEWLVTMRCCGFSKMLCTLHKEKTKRYNETHEALCLRCASHTERGEGMEFTPIKPKA